VRSNRGQLTGTAKVDPAIRRGVVSIPHGHYGANVNVLTPSRASDMGRSATFHGTEVTLRAASA